MRAITEREREVLALVAQGQRNRDIAEALGCTPTTIKNHIAHILAKLDCHTRTQAAAVWWKAETSGQRL